MEGCGQLAFAMCWGDGFVTDPGLIQKYGLTDPGPFLASVVSSSYANNVVISPHYYPPSISGQSTKCALPLLPLQPLQDIPSCEQSRSRTQSALDLPEGLQE